MTDLCRSAMYRFLLSLKQPDGSFIMHAGGEVDVRWVFASARAVRRSDAHGRIHVAVAHTAL